MASDSSPPVVGNDTSWTDVMIEAMLVSKCNTTTIREAFPSVSKSAIYYKKNNFVKYGSVKQPEITRKRRGRRSKITPEMQQWIIQLLSETPALHQKEICKEIEAKFNVEVEKPTISRLLKKLKMHSAGRHGKPLVLKPYRKRATSAKTSPRDQIAEETVE